MPNSVTRLGQVTRTRGTLQTKVNSAGGSFTVPADTNFALCFASASLIGSLSAGEALFSQISISGEDFTKVTPTIPFGVTDANDSPHFELWGLLNPSQTGSTISFLWQWGNIPIANVRTQHLHWVFYKNVLGKYKSSTVSNSLKWVVTGTESDTTVSLGTSGNGNTVTAGDFQVVFTYGSSSPSQTHTINNGWTEVLDNVTGAETTDCAFSAYDTTSSTDDDATQIVTLGTDGAGPTIGIRAILEQDAVGSSGTPSIFLPTVSSSTKRPPRVYLNTTQTKAGATELAVQSYNDAGTSLTFNDPQGTGPTGSAFLGIENTSTRFIDWQAVTVNTGPQASGTPSIAAIEAAGNALRTTVTVTDVANSGETPGAGSETWNDGSSGNVITGSGFV
jgi:hypothetical protein